MISNQKQKLKTKIKKMKHNSVTTIKCRFSNSAHELLDPNYGNKNREAWKTKNKVYTNAEKIEIFDKLKKVVKNITLTDK